MSSLFIITISIIFSAFFSGMEIAFISSNKLRFELAKKQNKFPSGIISIFTRNSGQYIATMLVGNNIALVIYGIEIAKLLEPKIALFIHSDLIILLIQTLISTLIILLSAEFLPKTIFRINPNGLLNIFSIVVLFFYYLLYPITLFTIAFSNKLIGVFFKGTEFRDENKNVFTKIDINNLMNEVESNSLKGSEELGRDIQIFKNALDFSEVKIRECMVPRNEIVAIEINSSIEDLSQKFIESGYSKILIYKESIDNIIGYFNAKDLFKDPKSIKAKMLGLIIVPETMPANKLLEQFNRENRGIALIVDEFGGTAGLVTIEDIIEEITGEIEDEHDKEDWVEKQLNEKEYIFSARLEIDYINEKFRINIPESEEYETIAGYIIHHFGNIPEKGDLIHIDKFTFTILESSKTKIKIVQILIA